RRLSCGARIGWRGVGTGDGWGTLGVVARERAGGRPVAITAMHLTGLAGYPPGSPLVFHAADGPGAAPVRLGLLLMGTLDGVDAAKVSIDPPLTVDPFLPGIGRPRGCRPVSAADLRAPVQMYGARSRYRAGLIVGVATDFPADGLRGAFLVEMRCGNGDSGAVCCGLDGAALGLYVGSLAADAGIQVFCPMDAVLEALDCELAVDGG
ncbi:MAG TPA: hypothetical protein VE913_22720, partial [Longimicrobium sp.]|nr:hypothetical protein [Longimicrobium sp.]